MDENIEPIQEAADELQYMNVHTLLLMPDSDLEPVAAAASYSARSRNPLPKGFPAKPLAQLPSQHDSSQGSRPSSSIRSFTAAPPPHHWQSAAINQPRSNQVSTNLVVSPSSIPPHAPIEMHRRISEILRELSSHAVLDYALQPKDKPELTIGLVWNGTRYIPDRAFLDSGANICIVSHKFAKSINMPVYFTPVRLATSVLENQLVFGVTPPVILQFGANEQKIDIETSFLVTRGMEHLYDILIFNRASHLFKGVTDHGSNTFSLISPNGSIIRVPIHTNP